MKLKIFVCRMISLITTVLFIMQSFALPADLLSSDSVSRNTLHNQSLFKNKSFVNSVKTSAQTELSPEELQKAKGAIKGADKALEIVEEVLSGENTDEIKNKIKWHYQQWEAGVDSESEILNVTGLLSRNALIHGWLLRSFPTPAGSWGKVDALWVGQNLSKVEMRIFNRKGELKLKFTGYKGEKDSPVENGHSDWIWDKDEKQFIFQKEVNPVRLQMEEYFKAWNKDPGTPAPADLFDITEILKSGLIYGQMAHSFPTPEGTWGKRSGGMGLGLELTRVEMRIFNDQGNLKLEFTGYRGDPENVYEIGRSLWVWNRDEKKFILQKEMNPARIEIEEYFKAWNKNHEIPAPTRMFDITDLLKSRLKQGSIPPFFPTPAGIWGKNEALGLGKKLNRVEMGIFNDQGLLKLEFVSYRNKEGRLVEHKRSYWTWDAGQQKFIYEQNPVRVQIQQYFKAWNKDPKTPPPADLFDVTEILKAGLKYGQIYHSFPTPAGTWKKQAPLGIGKKLSRVEMRIDNEEGALILEFTGYRGDKNNLHEIGRTYWIWDEKIKEFKRMATDIESLMDQLGLSEVVALLGHDPLRMSQYLHLYHPDLAPEIIDHIAVSALNGLAKTNFDELHWDYKTSLTPPELNPFDQNTSGHAFVLSGRVSSGIPFIRVVGDYSRKIKVRKDGFFSVNIPLPVTGGVNQFSLYAFDSETKQRSQTLEIKINQTTPVEDQNTVFNRLLSLKLDLLEDIQRSPDRYAFLVRSLEQTLLGDFTGDEEKGYEKLLKRIEEEKSPAMKSILESIRIKFREIMDAKPVLKKDEKLFFFQKYTRYEMENLRRNGAKGCIVALEQGLGKTITTLVYLNGEEASIITPNTVVSSWLEQEKKFIPEPRLKPLEGPYAERDENLEKFDHPQLVTNMEYLRGMPEERALSLSRKMIVIDEADFLGSKRSLQTIGAMQLQGEFKILLTATPFKRISDIANVLKYLMPEDPRFQSQAAFAKAFPEDSPESMNSLYLLLQKHVLRIRKKDVFREYDPARPLKDQGLRLPQKIEIDPEEEGKFELTEKQCESISELFQSYQEWRKKYRDNDVFENLQYPDGFFAKREALRQIMNNPGFAGLNEPSPKHLEMDRIVNKELKGQGNEKRKMVIFCRYRAQVQEYLKRYEELGARAYYGDLPQDKNGYKIDESNGKILYYQVDEYGIPVLKNGFPVPADRLNGMPLRALDYERIVFQNNPNARILVATYNSGAVGVTFLGADVVVDDDVAATYKDQYQSDDRAHRIDDQNKKYNITYYRLQARYPESFLKKLDPGIREKFFSMGTYDQVCTDMMALQKKIFHRIVDGVGSDDELKPIQENYFKGRMSFLFDENVQMENSKSLEEDSMTEASAPDFAYAATHLGIRDGRLLENLLTDHDFTDLLKKAFVKLLIHEGKIDLPELEKLVRNMDRVKQVMEYLEDFVPEEMKKNYIKSLAVYLCLMDEEIKNGTPLHELNTRKLLKKAA